MPAYSSRYKKLHDIEWFFERLGFRVHSVSNAGEIPARIDRDENMRLQFTVEETPDIIDDEGVYVNEEYVRYRMAMIGNNREGAFEDYVYGFKRMARKGFCSFNRDIMQGEESWKYILIARPVDERIRQELNLEMPVLRDGEDIEVGEIAYQYGDKEFRSWYFEVLSQIRPEA